MFSKLTALEHLSICTNAYEHPGHLWDSISKSCPGLSSLEITGKLDPEHLIRAHAPVFENVKRLTIGDVKPGVCSFETIRMLDNFAPKLEKLMLNGECFRSQHIYEAWVEFQKTHEYFRRRL